MGTCASTGATRITQEAPKANASTNSARTETDNVVLRRPGSSPLKITDVRVIIIGNTGSGKSSLGNTLLGREIFDVGSTLGATTTTCMWGDHSIDGINLKVTDTPGLSELSKDEFVKEMTRSFALSCPGPHVVILVLRCDRPFTKEHHAIVMTLLDLFVDKNRRFFMIVFAGGDSLSASDDGMQLALQKKLLSAPEHLKEVLREVDNTYCVVDNTGSCDHEKRKNQARIVFSMIKTLVKRNKEEYFTNDKWAQYNECVQAQIKHLTDTKNLKPTDAEEQVRNDVVKGSLWSEMLKTGMTYISPAITAARGIASFLWS